MAASFAALAADFAWTEQIGNSLVVREPIGVIGAITPWNFPLQQIVSKLAPALLAGNTMVFKPSEIAPLTAAILAEVAAEAGLPAGVFNVVHGTGPTVGEAIAAHPGIDMVSFTGSTRAGQAGLRRGRARPSSASRWSSAASPPTSSLTTPTFPRRSRVASPWSSPTAARSAARGRGCWCRPRGRTRRSNWPSRPPLPTPSATRRTKTVHLGPMASEQHRQRVNGYIERGLADGARSSSAAPGGPAGSKGPTYDRRSSPTSTPDAVIAQEEIFGPVLTIIPYTGDDQAVEIANSTMYGLTGAVFGSHDRAMAIARRLRTGQVDVNGAHWNVLAPFGGYKQSGNGREFGRHGLEEYLETKSIQG